MKKKKKKGTTEQDDHSARSQESMEQLTHAAAQAGVHKFVEALDHFADPSARREQQKTCQTTSKGISLKEYSGTFQPITLLLEITECST